MGPTDNSSYARSGNVMYKLIIKPLNVKNILLSLQMLGENMNLMFLAAKDPSLTLLMKPAGLIFTLGEYL